MRVVAVVVVLVMSACARTVAQDARTGPDGSTQTPRRIRLVNNEVAVRGIVTYPGGDRTDWLLLELPANQIGSLDIRLQWSAPRPGLQLGFDVFDASFTPFRSSRLKSRGGTRKEIVRGARGEIYIRVYARNRGDAGAYRLTIAFEEAYVCVLYAHEDPFGDIPDPPSLPAVPPIESSCADASCTTVPLAVPQGIAPSSAPSRHRGPGAARR